MDDKLKKRILMFNIGGVVNAVLGLYVLLQGHTFLESDTARTLTVVLFVFAAVDFYFPFSMRRKWMEENAKKDTGNSAAPGQQ